MPSTLGYQSVDEYNQNTWGPGGRPGQSKQHFGGYRPGGKDLERSTGNAIGGQYNLARMMGDFGQNQFNLAGPAYGQAMGFYQNLLGSGQQQRQALEPAIGNIRETEAGAQSSIRKRMGRSGAREMAMAESKRGTQGDINSMLAGAPMIGAEGAGRLAEGGLSRVLGAGQVGSSALASMGGLSLAAQEAEAKRKAASRSRWASIGKWAGRIGAAYFTGGLSEVTGADSAISA